MTEDARIGTVVFLAEMLSRLSSVTIPPRAPDYDCWQTSVRDIVSAPSKRGASQKRPFMQWRQCVLGFVAKGADWLVRT